MKALSLKRMANWKQLELFEREAGTLASLSHPCIPRYVAHFEQDTQQDRAFFLVQVHPSLCISSILPQCPPSPSWEGPGSHR